MNRWVLLSLFCCITAGCGTEQQSIEPVFPVSGVITFNGKPVVGADVTFFNAERKRSAFGRTNDRGEYQLTTFSLNDGAVEGKAVLTVSKFVAPPETTKEADIDSEAYEPPVVGGRQAKPKKAKPELPERYSSQATSGLIAVITPDGPNNLNFDLTL